MKTNTFEFNGQLIEFAEIDGIIQINTRHICKALGTKYKIQYTILNAHVPEDDFVYINKDQFLRLSYICGWLFRFRSEIEDEDIACDILDLAQELFYCIEEKFLYNNVLAKIKAG